jgi:hypothetical protein
MRFLESIMDDLIFFMFCVIMAGISLYYGYISAQLQFGRGKTLEQVFKHDSLFSVVLALLFTVLAFTLPVFFSANMLGDHFAEIYPYRDGFVLLKDTGINFFFLLLLIGAPLFSGIYIRYRMTDLKAEEKEQKLADAKPDLKNQVQYN